MHALQRLLRDGLARRGWSQSDLARESGLSRQSVSNLLREDRSPVARLLRETTVDGLARALQVDAGVVRAAIAEEMGLPGSDVQVVYDARGVADDDLIRELARRLGTASAPAAAPVSPSGAGQELGSPLSLVVADPAGHRSGPEDERDGGLAPETVTWAARAGEPDHSPRPADDIADAPTAGGVHGAAEGPGLV